MNRILPVLTIAVAALIGFSMAPAFADQSADEAAIRDVEAQQQVAWNRHDAKAYADLFAEDGDVVNVLGWWWHGRSQIEKKLADAYAVVFHDSMLTITEIDVRFLTPTIAVAHVRWAMIGAKSADGTSAPPQHGIQTQTLQKIDGRWLIAAFHNTNGVPEAPFQTKPATAN